MQKKTLDKLEYNKIIQLLTNEASSKMGKELTSALLPAISLNEILNMQKETNEAVSMLLKRGSLPIGGIKDIRGPIKRAKINANLSIKELLHVGDTLYATKKVKYYGLDDKDKDAQYEILEGLFEGLLPLSNLEKEINRCILNEEEIDDQASSTLSNIRRSIKNSNGKIKQQLHKMIHSTAYKNMLQEPVVTMRNERYCIPVKSEYRGSVKGMIHDQSSSGSTVFIEPMAVVQLNNEIKELFNKEKAEIEKILNDLSSEVAENVDIIEENLKLLTQLDFIFAKGKLSLKMKASRPHFNEKGYINIKKGRHPLLDQNSVVPIDIYLGKDFTTLVITGPNTGGKTVTLKTLGLFTLMGQAGLQIPAADHSELAVFSNVFADIGDEQSIEQSLSTFSSHMVNIVDLLKEVTYDSLVLFDELGAGTDPIEGAALAMSILQSLQKRSIRTVATTHYSELKVYALSTNGVENASCEFNVTTLRPTYKLLIGVPGKSNAFAISKRLGITDDIINQAKNLIEHDDQKFEDIITDLEISKKEVLLEKEKAQRYRKDAEILKNRVQSQEEKLANQKDNILKKAREEARDILQNAKDEADQLLKDLNKAVRENQKSIDFKALESQRSKIRSKLSKAEGDLTKHYQPQPTKTVGKKVKKVQEGNKVFVPAFNQECIVISKPDQKGDMMVQAGIMKMKVNLKNVTLVEEKGQYSDKNKKVSGEKGKTRMKKSQNIKTEIDLRGKYGDEAMNLLDKYIDDAYLSGLTQITIIHGKGTGVLRKETHKLLKRNSHVLEFRLGKYGEGESGVTIAVLK